MNWTPLAVAGAGIIAQIIFGYGTYKFFTGRTVEKFASLDARLDRMDRDAAQQWKQINETAGDLKYLQGVIDGKAKGASAHD